MIQLATLSFLKELAENNEREWFTKNKQRYESAKANVLEFTGGLIAGMAKFDSEIPAALEAKDCLMRIYRDVRFSKDKAPYKTNFGIAISANGKNFNGPGYYLHIEPGKCFVGGGSWMPIPEHLKAIRQEIDYNGAELSKILKNPDFKKTYGDLSVEDQLKTTPKGYAADHPMIHYLKLKGFTAGSKFDDKFLNSVGASSEIVNMFETLYPFISFLRNAIA